MTTDELKKEFEKYLKDSSDYYDPREPLTERKLLQMWLDCADPREKRITELEKENAELKEINTHTLSQLNLDNGELITQLTKAKEIIKELLDTQRCLDPYGDIFKNRILKAEQFLSEVEK